MLGRRTAFLTLPIGDDRIYCYCDLVSPRDPDSAEYGPAERLRQNALRDRGRRLPSRPRRPRSPPFRRRRLGCSSRSGSNRSPTNCPTARRSLLRVTRPARRSASRSSPASSGCRRDGAHGARPARRTRLPLPPSGGHGVQSAGEPGFAGFWRPNRPFVRLSAAPRASAGAPIRSWDSGAKEAKRACPCACPRRVRPRRGGAGYVPQDGERAGPDGGATIREEAISALGGLGPGAGAEAVTWALQDPSERVRCAAVRVLATRGESGELAAALAWLEPTAESHRLAVEAILETHVVSGGGDPGIARTVASAMVRANGRRP